MQVDTLKGQVASAEQWIKQATAAMAAQKPLKEMRKLLHTGERLPVETAEAADLKRHIRFREWEDAAGKALSGRVTVSSATQLLAEAPAMGAVTSARAQVRLLLGAIVVVVRLNTLFIGYSNPSNSCFYNRIRILFICFHTCHGSCHVCQRSSAPPPQQ